MPNFTAMAGFAIASMNTPSPRPPCMPHAKNTTNIRNWKPKLTTQFPIGTSPLSAKHTISMRFNGVNIRCSAISTQVDKEKAISNSDSFFANDIRPIMLFDGVCNLCNGGVKFVYDNDTKKNIRFEALQSEAGRKLLIRSGRSPDDISSVVLVEKDRSFIKSEAVLRILSYLDLPFPQVSAFLHLAPLFLRDIVYDNVANNRYAIFGKSNSCTMNWTTPPSK